MPGASVNLPVLSYQGVRVVTTETLAEGYGTRVTNIRTNLDANRQRFIEGLHLYTVSGKELADLRVSNPDAQISSKTRSLTLWTEKGAARMSKIVDTNQAWDFFEILGDSYFNLREVYGVMLPNIDDPIQLGIVWADAMESVWKSA
ncbi:hypothetical protein GTPT_2554 [Tatumella ptyseos ATCC 33301]|uniref:KilA-N DNA-binding domain-containing protein n=2 Tax=Tatumella ptyseos TaxID=82987 RepID=A0A085JD18_9GAMM|nr:ORF6N domain-containing protein [Tatumella ptyseos]KFD18364.1 hypothetical protein GTPT_2554 [Tatumella ptyseos ATCC 33301]